MFEVSIEAFIVMIGISGILFLIFKGIIRPYKKFCFYRKILTTSYKTLVHPYRILGLGIFGKQREYYLKYGDSLYMVKRQYPTFH